MLDDVPRIFEVVFQCTVEVGITTLFFTVHTQSHVEISLIVRSGQMITKNFEDYPEHRLKFFSLLHAISTHCFKALIQLSSQVCGNFF